MAFLFAGLILVPAVGFRWFHWNAVFSFWFAYVVTRPLGASFADWMGKPRIVGGLGWGDGNVALVLTAVIFCLVAFLAVTAPTSGAAAAAFRPGVRARTRPRSRRPTGPVDAAVSSLAPVPPRGARTTADMESCPAHEPPSG